MQTIDFSYTDPDALAKAAIKTHLLKPLEACIVYYDPDLPLTIQLSFLRKAIRRSSRVVWTITEAMARDGKFMAVAREVKGLSALSVQFTLAPNCGIRHTGRNSTYDPDLVASFLELKNVNRDFFEIIPEIQITEDLTDLGSTLMELAKAEPRWIVLATNEPPDTHRVNQLKNCFEYLQMRGFPLVEIHFSFGRTYSNAWKLLTGCFFSGPEEVHLDISNKCTHSCNFCAVYAPVAVQEMKDASGGSLPDKMREFMSAQLPFERAERIIESLPATTVKIQFGGAGDPMNHPQAMEMLRLTRQRGFGVEVLTNMEYFTDTDLIELTQMGGPSFINFRIIANISAATPETYLLTRPRQSATSFHKAVSSLKRLSELRLDNGGSGAHFDLMCVTTRQNYREALAYVRLAHSIGARGVWFKPLEVHHRSHYDLLPALEEQEDYVRTLKAAFALAAELGLAVDQPITFPEPRKRREAAHV